MCLRAAEGEGRDDRAHLQQFRWNHGLGSMIG